MLPDAITAIPGLRGGPWRYLLAASLVAFPALLAACGGGGPGEAPTATPPLTGDETQARTVALPADDMPAGLALRSEAITTNEQAAKDEDEAQRFQQWGRLLGYKAVYSREVSAQQVDSDGTVSVTVVVDLFADEVGASEALTYSASQAPTGMFGDSPFWGRVRALKTHAVPRPVFGDDGFAWQTTATALLPDSDAEVPFVANMIVVRRGRAIERLITGAFPGSTADQELAALIQAMANRLKESLP